MKKNGKRYRKKQKEKELKQQMIIINEEVDGIKTANFAFAQIIMCNPIISEIEGIRKEYYERLKNYVKLVGGDRRKNEKSELEVYKKCLCENNDMNVANEIDFYKHFILLDFVHILGYSTNKITNEKLNIVKKQYLIDFENSKATTFNKIVNCFKNNQNRIDKLLKDDLFVNEREYLELIKRNITFMQSQKTFNLMVTATMSAGKSTFVNSLIGKYICLSQNMACTSKIHSVINKAFEDGFTTELDHDLVMTASEEELLNDNEENTSDTIYVATHFNGSLSDSRIIINDSPGVNFSGEQEHRNITERLLKRRKYNLLIYLMNSTQLGTNDEDGHLDFVKRVIGRTPIIFVMNKVDSINPEEENIEEIIQRQILYLNKKGFKNPIVCPVSARAAFLAKKKEQGELLQYEEMEYFNYAIKFKQMSLKKYYKKLIPNIEDICVNEDSLIETSGIKYIEEILKAYAKGGK